MKALKLILTTLLFLASFAAEAQNVVIYKDGNIVREYTAEQVDSVVYVPAKEVKYYYYVGTVKPTVDSDIEANGIEIDSPDKLKGFTVESNEYVYFCYPTEWGTAKLIDDDGDAIPGKSVLELSNVAFTKYKGWRFNKYAEGLHVYITFEK